MDITRLESLQVIHCNDFEINKILNSHGASMHALKNIEYNFVSNIDLKDFLKSMANMSELFRREFVLEKLVLRHLNISQIFKSSLYLSNLREITQSRACKTIELKLGVLILDQVLEGFNIELITPKATSNKALKTVHDMICLENYIPITDDTVMFFKILDPDNKAELLVTAVTV